MDKKWAFNKWQQNWDEIFLLYHTDSQVVTSSGFTKKNNEHLGFKMKTILTVNAHG